MLTPLITYQLVSNDYIPQFSISSKGKRVKVDYDDDVEAWGTDNHQYRIHHPILTIPVSEECVRTWINQVALSIAARILHVSDPNTTAWVFSKVVGKGTQSVGSRLQKTPPPDSDNVPVRRLIVEAKTPCTFSLSY